MNYYKHKSEVFDMAQKLHEKKFISLSSGNISVLTLDGNIAITPSGVLYEIMKSEDIVIINLEGNVIEGKLRPSSEYQLHTEIYKTRSDITAVIHTHSKYAIAYASVGKEIPVSNLEIFAAGGPIPVAPFATPGTKEVGIYAAKYFSNNYRLKSLLMQNHGMVAIGETLNNAYINAHNTEIGAEINFIALQLGKEIKVLSEKQINEIREIYQK